MFMQALAAANWRALTTANIHFSAGVARAALRRCVAGPRLPTWSWTFECIVAGLAATLPQDSAGGLDTLRAAVDQGGLLAIPRAVKVTDAVAAGVPVEWLRGPRSATDAVLLYLHGGGYLFGSPRSHRALAAALVQATGMQALLPSYRLAPEHPYPAALEDAWAAYWWLLDQGIAPERIVLAGESAGGGLTIALLLALRDAGLPLPACAVCISPWVDMTLSSPSLHTNAATDYLNLAGLRAAVPLVLAGADPHTPTISPVFADLHGLPPLLIQAGTAELLYDDARRLAHRAADDGVAVQFEPWENMVHAWHILFAFEPAARSAIRRIAQFVHGHVHVTSMPPLGGAPALSPRQPSAPEGVHHI